MSSAIEISSEDLVFKALADAKRRQILDLLRNTPLSTGEICDQFGALDRCTVMQHLAVLEKANLIIVQRIGRTRMNYLNAGPLIEIQERWLGGFRGSALGLLSALQKPSQV